MAKYYKLLTVSCWLLAVGLTFACQEGREAGDLFGQWKQEGVGNRHISFSGSVVWLNATSDGNIYGNFQHIGDSLFMQCYSNRALPEDTILVEELFGFKPINDIRLKIEVLDSEHLILNKGERTWKLIKY